MTTDYLARHTPRPGPAIAASVIDARAALEAAATDLLATPDAMLERPWRWREHDADVRYGLFRPIEAVEAAGAAVAAILGSAGAARTASAQLVAPATTARWALQARLAALDDDILDRVPKAGEWTIRETLGHIISSQRGYPVFTAWYWARNRNEPVTDEERAALDAEVALPDEPDEGAGSLADVRARLDETTDSNGALAGMDEADLARPARWSGIPVDVGFRVARPSSHVYEHAIQVDKTLAWLGWQPTEAQRIVRELYDAWGRLEAQVWPMDPSALAARDASGRSVDGLLAALSAELVADAASVRVATGA
jgi:hypothetical protein